MEIKNIIFNRSFVKVAEDSATKAKTAEAVRIRVPEALSAVGDHQHRHHCFHCPLSIGGQRQATSGKSLHSSPCWAALTHSPSRMGIDDRPQAQYRHNHHANVVPICPPDQEDPIDKAIGNASLPCPTLERRPPYLAEPTTKFSLLDEGWVDCHVKNADLS